MTPQQRAQLRDAGRQAAAQLPDMPRELCERVAALLAPGLNEFVRNERAAKAATVKASPAGGSDGTV